MAFKPVRIEDSDKYVVTDLKMAKRPSLTKTLAEAAFYGAWLAGTPGRKQDSKTYQRTFEQYLKRFSKMPALALRTVARAASAEANRSIEAYNEASAGKYKSSYRTVSGSTDPGGTSRQI
jgi:hypothetical protein